MKGILFVAVFIALISSASAEVIISEVMYAPTFSEDYNEWIEIYNSGSEDVNLSGWKVCSNELLAGYVDHSDNMTKDDDGLILGAGDYAIITDGNSGTEAYDNFGISNSLALHTDAASICGRLSNSGKEIFLFNVNETIDNITYSSDLANKNNMSIQLEDDDWCEGIPTPGESNECYESPEEHDLEENIEDSNEENETSEDNETQKEDDIVIEEVTSTEKITAKAVSTPTEPKAESNVSTPEKKKVIYQSKSDKMRKTALYLSIGLFGLLIIYLFKSNKF